MSEKISDNMLLIGQSAPPFQARAVNGIINFPEDYDGEWVVIFSIPQDLHPDVILESKEFAEILSNFEKMHTKLIGLCEDSIYRYLHISNLYAKLENQHLENVIKKISVVEDVKKKITKNYCMINTKFQLQATEGLVVIVDPLCRIRCIQNYMNSTWENLKEINQIITAFQNVDTEKQEQWDE